MKKLISFLEIPSVDFNRTVKFYETILRIKLAVHDWGSEKMAFFPEENGECCGAISWSENFKPPKDGVLIHLNCKDINSTLSLIETNGGQIHTPKTKIEVEGRGYFALFIDSEGNRLGLYSDK